MNSQTVFPTKGNLLNIKKSLGLARMGFELMDRKRNILIRELMTLIDRAKSIRTRIDDTYTRAYAALQRANITLGQSVCNNIAATIPLEDSVEISFRSVMGVELPSVTIQSESPQPSYGLSDTNSQLDYAYLCFQQVKGMIAELAELENCIYRLATAIKKTQSRANALKNIIIPQFEESSKFISDALEEKEREDFSRLKVIKSTKAKKEEA